MPLACNNPLALISSIHEGVSLLETSAFREPFKASHGYGERMGAWLTWHSRQPVLSPSPYVVVGLLFFIPTSNHGTIIVHSIISLQVKDFISPTVRDWKKSSFICVRYIMVQMTKTIKNFKVLDSFPHCPILSIYNWNFLLQLHSYLL